MKTKFLKIIILCLVLSFFLNAKVSIKDIEYLKGDEFIQLYFKTDKIIPIPDLFYPVKDNNKFLVMRINDVNFELDKNIYQFKSPIVDNINIKYNNKYVDVEILLKERVNYRVFTNQNGLYIEFPNIKGTKSAINKKLVQPQKSKKTTEIFKNENISISPHKNIIKNIVLTRDKNNLDFKFLMADKVDYKVIPITKSPIRLAIDFKNTWSKKIQKDINYLNVKTIRGAHNSSSIFRVVFDLFYLKKYNVSVKNNILKIKFYNENSIKTEKKEIIAKTKTSIKKDNTPKVVLANNTKDSIPSPLKDNNESLDNKPIKNDTKSPKSEIKINSTPVFKKKNEFFTEEKSKANKENLEKSFVSTQDDQGTPKTTYLIQTIEEGEKKYSGEPISFKFYDMDLRNILLTFAKLASLSIVIDPGVTGKVTCEMYDIPWDQALQYFLKINKLDMVQDGRLLRIGKVDVLAREAEERRKLKEAREMEGDLTLATRVLSYIKVSEIVGLLKKQLSPRGDIQTDARSNTLIIKEVPDKIKLLDRLIDTLDIANPQVAIEARIVETNSNYIKNLGIQWGYNFSADAIHGNQTTLKFPNSINISGDQILNTQNPGLLGKLGGYAINLPAPGRTSGTAFSFANVARTFNLDVALSAMETQGKGRIISAPKITTQNNMQAHIMQGRQIPVQQSINNTITVRMVPAALELRVTPQITARGTIVLAIDIKNNSADFANTVNGIPPIITQSITNSVMVKDGGTIVIGGIFRVEESDQIDSVPLLSKIPLLGKLFKSTLKRGEQKELLIFMTPRIIK